MRHEILEILNWSARLRHRPSTASRWRRAEKKLCWVERQKTAGSAAVACCKLFCATVWKGCGANTAASYTLVSSSEPGTLNVLLSLRCLCELEQFFCAHPGGGRFRVATNYRQAIRPNLHHRASRWRRDLRHPCMFSSKPLKPPSLAKLPHKQYCRQVDRPVAGLRLPPSPAAMARCRTDATTRAPCPRAQFLPRAPPL